MSSPITEDEKALLEMWAAIDDATKKVVHRFMAANLDFKKRGLNFDPTVMKALTNVLVTANEAPVPGRPTAKYKPGDRVTVLGWGSRATGTVTSLDWVYHNRLAEYVWGYGVAYDVGHVAPLTMYYVPEGYLRPLEVQSEGAPT